MKKIENQADGTTNPQPIENKTTTVANKSLTSKEVLNKLLEHVAPVNYYKEAFRENTSIYSTGNKLSDKHFLVVTIDKLMELAESNDWGLCKNQGQTYVFNGEFWSAIDKETLADFLGKAAFKMGVGAIESKYHIFKENLVKQFYSSAYLDTPIVNDEAVKVNLQNCTLEVMPQRCGDDFKLTLARRSFDRNDFMTYQLPFDYDPTAKAPKFTTFLDEVLPDPDSQKVLAEYIGYLFVSNKMLKLEKALLLYGSGANGKSVFFEIITALLGSNNVSSYTLQSLTNDNGYFRIKIGDKLVNYASEISTKLNNAMFKALVSGEAVEARAPHKEPVMVERYAKFIFNCNTLPQDVEHSNAYFRRFLIIPFEVTIPADKQIKNLHALIIQDELSGIFNWALDGLKRLLERKEFTDCEAAQKALATYRLESDSAARFIDENGYIKSTTDKFPIPALYQFYLEYCKDNTFHPLSKPKFIKRLRTLDIEVVRINTGNVALLAPSDVDTEL